MQPAPSKVSQNATLVDQHRQPSPPAQHGLPDLEQPASDGVLHSSRLREPTPHLEDTSDNLSVSSGGTRRGRPSDAGRVSRQDGSSQEGSPGSRIDEYERAYTNYRRPSDEMIFQVVPSAKDKTPKVSVESFPNGMRIYIHRNRAAY